MDIEQIIKILGKLLPTRAKTYLGLLRSLKSKVPTIGNFRYFKNFEKVIRKSNWYSTEEHLNDRHIDFEQRKLENLNRRKVKEYITQQRRLKRLQQRKIKAQKILQKLLKQAEDFYNPKKLRNKIAYQKSLRRRVINQLNFEAYSYGERDVDNLRHGIDFTTKGMNVKQLQATYITLKEQNDEMGINNQTAQHLTDTQLADLLWMIAEPHTYLWYVFGGLELEQGKPRDPLWREKGLAILRKDVKNERERKRLIKLYE